MTKKSYYNFKFKKCLFGATTVVKHRDKEKHVYSGYGIIFDSTGSCSFNNDSARNFIIFGVDNSSSSYADNRKNNFLVLGDDPTFGINNSPEKKFSIKFSKVKTKFCLSLHYNADISYFLLMKKKSLNSKSAIKMSTFQLNLSRKYISEVYRSIFK